MKKALSTFLVVMMMLSIFTHCGSEQEASPESTDSGYSESVTATVEPDETEEPQETLTPESTPESSETPEASFGVPPTAEDVAFDLALVPVYSGSPYVAVNDNIPYFAKDEITAASFESYAPLDSLGRCGVAVASIGQDLMPTEERGSIGMVKPTGWHTVKYDCVDGKYLYNRCHLIGFQLTGENANTSNLITGTRYLNMDGMLPFENMVADYVKETGNHVMYRSTPIFEGDNLLAAGVLLEGWSVEDSGDGICYCIFAYNVQPQVTLDYATGGSHSDCTPAPTEAPKVEEKPAPEANKEPAADYVLNNNSMKFHYPNCRSVKRMKESNKEYYTGSREDLIARGYEPCKNCDP